MAEPDRMAGHAFPMVATQAIASERLGRKRPDGPGL